MIAEPAREQQQQMSIVEDDHARISSLEAGNVPSIYMV
jgi:hypothetical protein